MYIFDLGCAPSGDSQTVNATARVRAPFSSMQSREPSSPNQHQCKARHAQKQDPPVRQPFRIQDDVQICRHACMHECIQNCMHAYIPTYQLPCLPDYLPECSACLPARPPTYIMHTYKHTYICVHKHVSTHSDARTHAHLLVCVGFWFWGQEFKQHIGIYAFHDVWDALQVSSLLLAWVRHRKAPGRLPMRSSSTSAGLRPSVSGCEFQL